MSEDEKNYYVALELFFGTIVRNELNNILSNDTVVLYDNLTLKEKTSFIMEVNTLYNRIVDKEEIVKRHLSKSS